MITRNTTGTSSSGSVDPSGNFSAGSSTEQYSGTTTDGAAQGSMQFDDGKCPFSANVNWTLQ